MEGSDFADKMVILAVKRGCPRCEFFSRNYQETFLKYLDMKNISIKTYTDPLTYPKWLGEKVYNKYNAPVFLIVSRDLFLNHPDKIRNIDIDVFEEHDSIDFDIVKIMEWLSSNIDFKMSGIPNFEKNKEEDDIPVRLVIRNSYIFTANTSMKL